jgi:thiol-disulfide isomerase/thioredoxin
MSKVTLKQIREGLKNGIVLYFAHASWCPYTVQFYPIFDKTIEKLHQNKKDKLFSIIRLDDTMVKSIRANYNDIYRKLADYDDNVDEYKLYFPTVVMFVNGKRYKYQVDVRTVKNFEEFIVSKLPKSKPLSRTTRTMRPLEPPRPFVRSRTPTQVALHEQIDKAFKKLFK